MKPKRVKKITDTDRLNWMQKNQTDVFHTVGYYWTKGNWHRPYKSLRQAIDTAIRQEKRGESCD